MGGRRQGEARAQHHHPEVWKDPSLKTAVVVSGHPSGLYEDSRAFGSGPGVPPSDPLLHDFQGAQWGEGAAQAIGPPAGPSVGA